MHMEGAAQPLAGLAIERRDVVDIGLIGHPRHLPNIVRGGSIPPNCAGNRSLIVWQTRANNPNEYDRSMKTA